MITHPEGWQVGMEVCVVVTINTRGEPKPRIATVSKIGRRWITLDDSGHKPTRFDAETHYIDGGAYSSPGKVYESEAEYRDTTLTEKMWKDLRSRMPWTAPEHFTPDDIEKISASIWPQSHGDPHNG
jgi:hypothetical protein